ncbi:MAG: hypothetical protein Q9182_005603 [Xanthomendoza sp. 2 TL-2023]
MVHFLWSVASAPALLFQRLFGFQGREAPKIAITRSRWTLLVHGSVHTVPAAVALCLIIINLKGCYWGKHLGGAGADFARDGIFLAFIQVLAKIQVWQQFTTHVSLNGTENDFWPATLTKKHAGLDQRDKSGQPGQNVVSAGLPALATYFAYNKNGKGGFAIDTPEIEYPRRIEGAPRVKGVNAEAWSFAPHTPTSLVMNNLWYDPHWYPKLGKPTGELSGELEAEAAAVRTVCDPSIQEVDKNTNSVALPALQDYHKWSPHNTKPGNMAVVSLAETLRRHNRTLGALLMARMESLGKRQTPIEFWRNNTAAIESVVSTAFADTISRIGMERQQIAGGYTPTEFVHECYQIPEEYTLCPPPAASEMDQWTSLEFKGFTKGYANKASKATDFIAIALLTIYVLIVIIYIASTCRDHRTFMCWDTVEELILLAKNSSPNNDRSGHNARADSASNETPIHVIKDRERSALQEHRLNPLANTSSGIASLATMNLNMRIRVNHPPSVGSDAIDRSKKQGRSVLPTGDVQMIFTDEEAANMQPVRPGVRYS